MSQGYPDMYQDFSSHRSPGATRYNGVTLNRQPSRHFNEFQQLQGQYMENDFVPRYESERYGRGLAAPVQTHHPYENQTWSYGGANAAHSMSGTGRVNAAPRGRPALPPTWMEQQQITHIPSHNPHQMNGHYNSQSHLQNTRVSPPLDNDELIPTAIVIKNIPFAIKKESLMDLMTEMHLPLPYAFNYHFDQGVFRGLAFANFTTAEETSAVIEAMNHLELQGRKLRVEYKKMLPAAERDRIERDKRERRGQLQEQHQPMSTSSLTHQASMSSMNSGVPATSPSPVNMRAGAGEPLNIDFNDPIVLSYYSELMLFKNDKAKDSLGFDSSIPPEERRIIHTLAHHMGLDHRSEGNGSQRQVNIYKKPLNVSPPAPQLPNGQYADSHRRVLNRAATTDFSEARGSDPGYYSHTLGRQRSDLLDIPGSPGLTGINDRQGALRAAKSFSELRSFSPSPALTTASFPQALAQNVSVFREYGMTSGASGTPPNLTPTSAGNPMNGRDDSLLTNSFGNLNISTGYDRQSAPRMNGRLVNQSDRDNQGSAAGPIGSQRPTNGHYDDNSRSATVITERQPRGPTSTSEWGNSTGFGRPRQNGHVNRGSGELDLASLQIQKAWDDNMS